MRDLIDGMHFGEKAKRAAAGDAVEPERIEDWRLPKPAARQLSDGRARLMAVLGGGARQSEPVTAAVAIARSIAGSSSRRRTGSGPILPPAGTGSSPR